MLLFSDQHNARVLGCYGNDEVFTPNLDRLAKEGVRYNRAYVQNPICTPSRMCYMSGQYPHNFGSYGLMGRKPEQLPHLFSHFKNAGYKTGMAGKIHTPKGWLSPYCDFVADGYGHDMKSDSNLQGDYAQDLMHKGIAEERDDKILQEWYAINGFDKGQGLDARPSRLSEEETIEAWIARETIQFIEEAHKDNRSFCFWMTLPRPHQTYAPAQKFWDMYDDKALTLPPNANHHLDGRHRSALRTQQYFQNEKDWRLFEEKDWEATRRRVLRGYYACVTQVDDAIGSVLNKLDELGIRENTIIVYASDHGEFAGEHGLIEKAPGISFHCVTRVPFIWSWPGHIPENVTRHTLIESVDFLPTICSLAGVAPPDWVDGIDMSETLYQDIDLKDIAITENAYTKTLHTKKYKFTQYLPELNDGVEHGELYDLEHDPWEMNNLYHLPEYSETIHALRYLLYTWLVRTTRHVTVHPNAPKQNTEGTVSWDDPHACTWVGQDGKVGFEVADTLIRRKQENYL